MKKHEDHQRVTAVTEHDGHTYIYDTNLLRKCEHVEKPRIQTDTCNTLLLVMAPQQLTI